VSVAASGRRLLSRELILEAAMRVADTDSVHALTMSRLGRELDADPTAMYRHFRNKDELLLAMADVMLSEAAANIVAGKDVADTLRDVSWAMREAYLRRPALACEVAARFTGGQAETQLVDVMLDSIKASGLGHDAAVWLVRALAEMVLGHVLMSANMLTLTEQQQRFDLEVGLRVYAEPSDPTPLAPLELRLRNTREDCDEVFNGMLETFLAGLRVTVAGKSGRSPEKSVPARS
jgi:AcrR family transcriptional regulator